MSFVAEVPTIKVFVKESALTQDPSNTKLVEGYLVSVHARYGRPLFFTVHLETGALWSMLPISAILCDRFGATFETLLVREVDILQPYSCLEGPIAVIAPQYLRNYEMEVRIDGEPQSANYLFTIDYAGTGMAEDPEQYKSHNIVVLSDGHLAALPNNYCLFIDNHFTGKELTYPKYKRSNKYHQPGS